MYKTLPFSSPTNPYLFGVEADVLEVVPQGEDGEVGGADDGAGAEVDARQRHRLVYPGLTHTLMIQRVSFPNARTDLQLEGTVALRLHVL